MSGPIPSVDAEVFRPPDAGRQSRWVRCVGALGHHVGQASVLAGTSPAADARHFPVQQGIAELADVRPGRRCPPGVPQRARQSIDHVMPARAASCGDPAVVLQPERLARHPPAGSARGARCDRRSVAPFPLGRSARGLWRGRQQTRRRGAGILRYHGLHRRIARRAARRLRSCRVQHRLGFGMPARCRDSPAERTARLARPTATATLRR